MRYIEMVSKSPTKSKIYWYVFSGEHFYKNCTIYQIRLNQTKPNLVVYYILFSIMWEPTKKNFSSLAPSGAEKIDPEVSKFEKCYFLVFLKKGPQGPQKRSKINSNGIFGYQGPKWPTKKIFGNFRDGGRKVCTCWLNGAKCNICSLFELNYFLWEDDIFRKQKMFCFLKNTRRCSASLKISSSNKRK